MVNKDECLNAIDVVIRYCKEVEQGHVPPRFALTNELDLLFDLITILEDYEKLLNRKEYYKHEYFAERDLREELQEQIENLKAQVVKDNQEQSLFTKSQCFNLMEFIELNIFDAIRNDPDADNIEWLIDMVDAYEKLKEMAEE